MQRAVGDLTKLSLARMEREMPWFAGLTAEQRAMIGMLLQAGYSSFIAWFKNPSDRPPPLNVEVFGNAPRSFAGVVNLQQTVAMVRLSIEVAEAELAGMVSPEYAAEVRASWPSRPPTSTPTPPRSAAPGTPASRRSSSTR
jgi:hypothetical protein